MQIHAFSFVLGPGHVLMEGTECQHHLNGISFSLPHLLKVHAHVRLGWQSRKWGVKGCPPTQEDMASAEVSVICSRKPQLRNFTTVLECKGLSEVIQNEEPQRGVWACPRAGPLPLRAQQQGLMENCGP